MIVHIGSTVGGGPCMRWKLPGRSSLRRWIQVRAFGDPAKRDGDEDHRDYTTHRRGKRKALRTRVDENPEHPGDHHPDDEADQPPANPPQRIPRIPVRALRRNTHVVVAHASEATNEHPSLGSYGG